MRGHLGSPLIWKDCLPGLLKASGGLHAWVTVAGSRGRVHGRGTSRPGAGRGRRGRGTGVKWPLLGFAGEDTRARWSGGFSRDPDGQRGPGAPSLPTATHPRGPSRRRPSPPLATLTGVAGYPPLPGPVWRELPATPLHGAPHPPPDRGPVCTSRCCPLHPPSPVCPWTEPRRLPLPEMPVALPFSRTLVTAGDVKRFCLRAAATLSVTSGDRSPAARGDVPAQPPPTHRSVGVRQKQAPPPSCRELGERESGRNGTVCLRPVVASRGGPDRAGCGQRLSQGPGPKHATAFVQKPPAGALGDSGAQGVQIGAQECRRVCQRSE